jgi:hypothetical protein
VNVAALDAPVLHLQLFDDVGHEVVRTKVDQIGNQRAVWHGRDENGGTALFAISKGIVSGAIYSDGRVFELTVNREGEYEVAELEPSAYPTEDPAGDVAVAIPDRPGSSPASGATTAPAGAADATSQIDVMILWTPAARNAVGGTQAAIDSLVTLAVANANQAYANSNVPATLNVVYSGEVAFTESPSAISSDLSALSSNSSIQALRTKYGADVVTLLGNGYAGAGSCGYSYVMSTVSTSFSPYAYGVVDQSCAAGYLSYAHEVGHTEGLQHDPANASGPQPAESYAYGYQDPAGAFRTVLSYGGATRIPYFSSPLVTYGGVPTGVASQDNARALRANVATVASFMSATGGCSYGVSPATISFSGSGGSAAISVSTSAGCGWSTSSGASWIGVGAGGSGSGTLTLTASANSGSQRTATATVAGHTVTVTEQAGAPVCTYSISPATISFPVTGGSTIVTVSTSAGCAWTTSAAGATWVNVSGSGSGAGSVTVTAATNSGGSRSANLTIAGLTEKVSQGGAPRVKGPKH